MEPTIIKNVELEDYRDNYLNVPVCSRPIEFEGIACSTDCVAFRCAALDGVIIGVMKMDAPKVNPKIYKLKGHKGMIQDLQFNPHYDNVLASTGEDGCVLLWKLKHVSDDTTSCMLMTGHMKRCTSIQWNPVVKKVICSISHDQNILSWDVERGKSMITIHVDNIPQCCKWNIEGSLLAYIDTSSYLKVIDMRLNKTINSVKCHGDAKKPKVTWVDGLRGSKYYLISSGFNINHCREIKLWDLRNIEEPVNVIELDSSPSTLYPFYDEGIGLISLFGKGESINRFLFYYGGSIKQLTGARSKFSHGGFGIAPKTLCETSKCEVMKFFKVESRNVHMSGVLVPRRNKDMFSPDLYPDLINEPTFTVDEWMNFAEKPIVRKPFLSLKKMLSEKEENNLNATYEKKSKTDIGNKRSDSNEDFRKHASLQKPSIGSPFLDIDKKNERPRYKSASTHATKGSIKEDKSPTGLKDPHVKNIMLRLLKAEEENVKLKKAISNLEERMKRIECAHDSSQTTEMIVDPMKMRQSEKFYPQLNSLTSETTHDTWKVDKEKPVFSSLNRNSKKEADKKIKFEKKMQSEKIMKLEKKIQSESDTLFNKEDNKEDKIKKNIKSENKIFFDLTFSDTERKIT